jgi:predicted ATP-grasp superfamily ATP-dependent carboligase
MRAARSPAERCAHDRPVLVSDHINGHSRSAIAAVRALDQAGFRTVVTVTGSGSPAAASRSCGDVLRIPADGAGALRRAVEEFVAAQPKAVVMAASDAVLIALGLPGRDLVDKSALPERAAAAGLSVPTTREFPDGALLAEAADSLEYPVVVKATVKTSGGENTRRVNSARDLRAAYAAHRSPLVVQPVAVGTMRAVCGVLHDGRLLAVVHQTYLRIWPPDCGTASAAITTTPDHDLEDRLPTLLAGHTGVFQVQLIGDEVIDVNPRVYGSLPLAVAAGANLPAIASRAALGCPPSGIVRGRPDVRYRWLEGDVRRLVHDVRAGGLPLRDAGRALLPRRGTAHSIESLRDPAPGLLRLAGAARTRLS